jgi:two-component system CheB/CheR fusion protein
MSSSNPSSPNASSPPPAAEDENGLPSLPPDYVEQDFGDQIDNVVPTRGYELPFMVGLGGSAGSIQALGEFFKAMPADSGMTFVVVLHLSPTHESVMAELLSKSTSMQVVQASDGQAVQPNHVYVIPPGKYLAAADGQLKLTELERARGKRVAIDTFFRSLADTYGPHAAAVVLSGADSDGAIGIKRIKERGGLTIAQDPDQSEHSDMPRSAIETGMVDWVLKVHEMPQHILDYQRTAARLKLPPEQGPPPMRPSQLTATDDELALRDVLVFLRTRTGRDFSYYKRATILRRIGRRLQVNGLESLQSYLQFLRTHPGEAGALLQDLLISVTNFFRDREVFEAVEHLIPELFKNKSQADTVRVWCPACATGEEAYSMAILLTEHARKLESPPSLQVFACDLDNEAIQVARAGQYPDTIAADVSDDRLRKFFVKDAKGYRVRRELREMVLFAAHDLLKDAPFSRMDLISCRNLLIYLNREAQRRVHDILHFALKPDGILVLGASDAIDDDSPLFRVRDKKHRIYVRQETLRSGLPAPSGPNSLLRTIEEQRQALGAPVVHGKHFVPEGMTTFHSQLGAKLDRNALAELHFKLIERYAPPSIIVNSEYDIIHLSPHAGDYLKFAGGEPTANLLQVVHPALRIELRTALFRATETHSPVESFDVPIEIEGRSYRIHVTVTSAVEVGAGFFLVTFERRASDSRSAAASVRDVATTPEPALSQLERENEQLKSNLRDMVEQYEGSTEELKASNEELQAMNEELRSATEELETSREELQSINEELTTVNQEMKGKMEEVAHANSDLQNLMASTSIATVFLDRDLAITRFTPAAATLFNMIPGDVGRPLAHLKHRLDYPQLIADVEQVLHTLVPIEREVTADHRWYFARIQPYRTLEDRIAGAVLTLVDVTERNRAIEELRESEERMRLLIESAKDYAIFSTDLDRRVNIWNSGAEKLFGYTESEILGRSADILFTPEDRAKGDAERESETASQEGRAENNRWHARKDGSVFYGSGSVMPLRDQAGGLRGFVKIMRDLTESKRTQEALREQLQELTRFNAAAVGRESRMIELKEEVNELCRRLGETTRYSLESLDEGNADDRIAGASR